MGHCSLLIGIRLRHIGTMDVPLRGGLKSIFTLLYRHTGNGHGATKRD